MYELKRVKTRILKPIKIIFLNNIFMMSGDSSVSKQERIDMIIFIKQTIPDVSLQNRKEILRIIQSSGINDDKIQTKGGGTQVKFKDLTYSTISVINNFLKERISTKMDKLATLVNEDVEEPE